MRMRLLLRLRVHLRLRLGMCLRVLLGHRLRAEMLLHRRVSHYTARHRHSVLVTGDRQMTFVVCHHNPELFAAVENFSTMVTTAVKVAMSEAIRSNVPDVRVTTNKYHVPVHRRGDIHVARSSHILRFRHYRR